MRPLRPCSSATSLISTTALAALALLLPLPADPADAPRLGSPRRNGERLQFEVSADAGSEVRLESSEDLRTWTPWATNSVPNAAPFTVEDPRPNSGPARFHRAVASGGLPRPNLAFTLGTPSKPATVTTNRPALELRLDGTPPDPDQLSVRVNGDRIPCAFERVDGGLRVLPFNPFPPGFVLVTASLTDTNFDQPPTARLELAVVPDGLNVPPVPRPDSTLAHAGLPRSIPVLENDRDPNGDALRLTGVGTPAHGTATIADNRVLYTASPGYAGPDQFTYSAADPAGAATTGTVHVTVRPAPAITVRVADVPHGVPHRADRGPAASTVESLDAALVEVCSQLAPGERGRIVIDSEKPMTVGNLRLSCPVDIESEEHVRAHLRGSAVLVDARAGAALAGLVFETPDLVQIRAGASLDLIGNEFTSGLHLQLPSSSPDLAARARQLHDPAAAAAQLLLDGNRIPTGIIDGAIPDNGVLEVARGEGQSLDASVHLETGAALKIEGSLVTDRIAIEASAEAGSTIETTDVASVGLLHRHIEGTATATASSRNVVAGHVRLVTEGGGSLTIDGRYTRSDRLEVDARAARTEYTGEDDVLVRAEVRAKAGPAAARATLVATERNAQIDGAVDLGNDPDTTLQVALRASTAKGPVVASLRGKAEIELTEDTTLEAELSVDAATDEETRVKLDHLTAKGRIGIRKGDASKVNLQANLTTILGGLGTSVGPDTELSGSITDSKVFGAGIGAGVALHWSLNQLPPVASRRPGRHLAAGSAPAPGLIISNVTFSGPTLPSAGIYLDRLRVPVQILACTFQHSDPSGIALTVQEVDAPVTVRDCRFQGCLTAFDGDLEDAGRQGRIAAPYRIENNVFNAPGKLLGVPFQDLENVIFRSNTVTAATCLQVTAGQALAEDNIFTADGLGTGAVVVGAGPNGPGALIARRNRITAAAPFFILGGGFANFDGGNIFTPAGLFPLLLLQVAGSDGQSAFLRLANNQFPTTFLTMGQNGIAHIAGNTFQTATVSDANSAGGLTVNPSQNAGVIPDASSTPVDFDGNGCSDLPPRCNGRDDNGDCNCGDTAVPPPSTPAWPYP